jgi:diguanylate cyclase (GGDEF)-like protein/PAS domain S-box-containing protein
MSQASVELKPRDRAPRPVPQGDALAVYRQVVEHARDTYLVVDHAGRIVFCNRAAGGLFGMATEDLIGRNFGFSFGPEGEPTPIELVSRGGGPLFVEMVATAMSWSGAPATLVALSDITTRHVRETELRMHAAAMETAANGIFITDRAGVIKWVNKAFEEVTGYGRDLLIGMNADRLKSGRHSDAFYAEMAARLSAGQSWKGRLVNRRKNGELYTADQTTTPIPDAAGRFSHFVSVQEDITERLRAEDQLIQLSEYDGLTGLPNRHQFTERLKSALERANRAGAAVAVMVMDLDNFKAINNTLGHKAGDILIQAVAARISKLMRTTDTLARLGGDDFGFLLESVTDMAAASRTVRRILDCLKQPVMVEGQLLKVSASLGIAAYPKDDTDPLSLLRMAELAMYQAKSQGGQAFRYFDRDMDADIRRRVQLESDLRRAIDQGELWLAFQPQFDLHRSRIVGAEALIRWNHPVRGVVSPGEFIPLAESSGLILPIGDWIIEEICRQSVAFARQGLADLQLGFNVSGVQFRQRDLYQQVTSSLNRAALPVEALDLEITETVAMERTSRVTENVDRIAAAGISISMDDFGTGYSSLSNLQAFRVKRLKVDASFVRGIGANREDEKIVEAVVRLGQSLGLKVVAEGVETAAQKEFLRDRGCDEIQGYLLSKPLPPAQFVDFVKRFAD